MSIEERYGQPWTEAEITLALRLYCEIPFQKTKASHPEVQALATRLGRTPSSVARKLGNFGAFDPTLAARGVVGLTHGSRADKEIWDRYASDWSKLVDDAEVLWPEIDPIEPAPTDIAPLERPAGPSQAARVVNARLHQAFFRRTVLASYNLACCACGLQLPSLLVASHIVPWASDESLRTDPTNGLALCAIHDRAFDRGLIALSDEKAFLVSRAVEADTSDAADVMLRCLDGREMREPSRFAPNPVHLKWHRERIFSRV